MTRCPNFFSIFAHLQFCQIWSHQYNTLSMQITFVTVFQFALVCYSNLGTASITRKSCYLTTIQSQTSCGLFVQNLWKVLPSIEKSIGDILFILFYPSMISITELFIHRDRRIHIERACSTNVKPSVNINRFLFTCSLYVYTNVYGHSSHLFVYFHFFDAVDRR